MRNVLVSLLVLASAMAVPAFAQQPPPPPTINVSGNGTIKVDPDMATVRLGVQAEAKTAKEAQALASGTAQKILNAITALGIEKRDIQTSNLMLYPVYGNPDPARPTRQVVTSYRAGNTVTIRVNDLTKVGPVIDASVAAGGNEIQGVDFGLKDDSVARREALKKAVADAKSKAQAIAEALGVQLGDIYEASESSVQVAPMPMAFRGVAMDAVATPVSAGQLDVTGSVSLRFKIR